MNQKEQRRLMVLNRVKRRQMMGREAVGVLGISVRYIRRVLAAYRNGSTAALAHGNRGRKPEHALDVDVRK